MFYLCSHLIKTPFRTKATEYGSKKAPSHNRPLTEFYSLNKNVRSNKDYLVPQSLFALGLILLE